MLHSRSEKRGGGEEGTNGRREGVREGREKGGRNGEWKKNKKVIGEGKKWRRKGRGEERKEREFHFKCYLLEN